MSTPTPTATRANWRTSPFNHQAFHDIPALLDTAAIANDPARFWPLAEAPRAFDDFHLTAPDGAVLDLPAFLDATATDAIAVLHDGRLVYEAYANGNGHHAPHILMSATKAVTGLIAGILHGDGALDPNALVTHYIPEIAGTAYDGATVRHLLDMRTGIVLEGDTLAAYEAATNWDPENPAHPNADFRSFFETLAASHNPHGGPFRYISANTDLLGWIMERATMRPFAELASDLLWQPLGAEDLTYVTTDRRGLPRCTGGFCSTVRDFARIGQLVVQGGRRDGAQIVPESWIEDLTNGGDHDAWANGEWGRVFGFVGASLRYRAGWYIVDDEPKSMFAMGIHGQNLFVDRENGIVVAKLSSQNDRFDYRAVPLTHLAFTEFRRCLLGE